MGLERGLFHPRNSLVRSPTSADRLLVRGCQGIMCIAGIAIIFIAGTLPQVWAGGQNIPNLTGNGQANNNDVSQKPDENCSLDDRRSLEMPTRSCCNADFLQEINRLRFRAKRLIQNAYQKLLYQPFSVKRALWNHFGVKPDDPIRIRVILKQLKNMLDATESSDVVFMCRDQGDPGCSGRQAATDNCSSSPVRRLWLCGDIALSSPFLYGNGWLRALIHEYAHVGCRETGGILWEGLEFYEDNKNNNNPPPAALAIKNADSYTHFILAVH